ncbi:Crp/Fnr family transcriptional regulator [Chitinophaga sp. 30R24]|uniref:Crp/Fnr family transcriptional regulator n=1 Tax=Chitinophaga sp. 30R24 TaxID=3248838 RepID=UPI003B9156EE
MNTFDFFLTHVRKRMPLLTVAEAEMMFASFREKRVKKRQLIVQPGFVARSRHLVVKGAFRAYVVDEKGEDRTIQLAIDDWWITDYNSYVFQAPATMFVVALEDSIILELGYEEEQSLKNSSRLVETFFRIKAERWAAFLQRRIIAGLTQSAEERYLDFLEKYPLLVQRMPQYVLASYLGMTTEFLSKIRHHKLKKKS